MPYIGNSLESSYFLGKRQSFLASSGQTSFSVNGGYNPGFIDIFRNGAKLAEGDYTATNGSNFVLTLGAALNDVVEIIDYGSVALANVVQKTGDTMTGNLAVQFDSAATSALTVYVSNLSYTGRGVDLGSAKAANSNFQFLSCATNNYADYEFYVRGDGEVRADGTIAGGGADYAEMFEWEDGNTNSEDRRGLSVVLVGEKIRVANVQDDPDDIIGVVSGNPTVLGDAGDLKWRGRYLRDEYGAYILVNNERQVNAEFDPDLEYIPRSKRKEWSAVGMMGKIYIRKDSPINPAWKLMKSLTLVDLYLVR